MWELFKVYGHEYREHTITGVIERLNKSGDWVRCQAAITVITLVD